MFHFRIGSIPVEVQASHLLVSGVLGMRSSPSSQEGFAGSMAYSVLSWMFIVFVSVLVHELGHAVVSRAFGYQPTITLAWMGGHTHPNAPGPIPWHKDVVLTLAGPLFGLLLGVACLAGYSLVDVQAVVLRELLFDAMVANFFWAVLNLLPVLPLDGGRITSVVSTRFFGQRGFLVSQGLALVTCLGLVAWGIQMGQPLLTVLFAMFGFQAARALFEAMKDSKPVSPEELAPLIRQLEQAQAALKGGDLEEARRRAQTVVEPSGPVSPELTSSAHHVLGWVALKEGQGRVALDHFSQVQREPVEPQALAAAFSLIGDESRALPLWEKAWRDTGSRTVMHEYAGSLIRAGKVDAALKLPGVEPETAFSFAERVLFIRGAYAEAAALGEAALSRVPSPTLAYNAACALARRQKVADALRLLHRAKELGYREAEAAASDEDLAPLRGHPEFEAWLAALRQSAAS